MADTLLSHEETPDCDILQGQLLTLVHQHRELQRHLLDAQLDEDDGEHGGSSAGPLPTFAQILVERQSTQRRLLELPEQRPPAPQHLALQQLADSSGSATTASASRAAAQHFKDLLLALKQEHRRAVRTACTISNLDRTPDFMRQAHSSSEFLALQSSPQLSSYLQALVLAQADAAARAARLKDGYQLQSSDLEAMALFALLNGPAERLGARFACRLQCIPWSHNHRFMIYEQVAGEDNAPRARKPSRDPQVLVPAPITTRAGTHAAVTQLLKHFGVEEEELPAVQAKEAHLQHAYLANKVTGKVAQALQRLPVLRSKIVGRQKGGEAQGSPFLTEVPDVAAEPDPLHQAHKVEMIDDHMNKLQSLGPSLAGDCSAGYAATIVKANITVDQELYAENQFLDEHDSQHAAIRLMFLSKQHVTRHRDDASGESAGGMTFSVAKVADQLPELETKTVEALFNLRYLYTRKSKLQVLHFCNAAVFLMLELLQDEHAETEAAEQRLTSPFAAAGAAAAAAATASPSSAVEDGQRAADTQTTAAGPSNCDLSNQYYVSELSPESGLVHIFRVADNQEVFHQYALEMFGKVETEILAVASHLLDNSKTFLEASGIQQQHTMDKMEVMKELWEAEAAYSAAKHKLLGTIAEACFQASGISVSKLQPLVSAPPKLSTLPPPARSYLRQLTLDMLFRRPNISLDELYFREKYQFEASSLVMEVELLQRVMQDVSSIQWDSLQQAATSAAASHDAQGGSTKPEDTWRPGLLPSMLLCSEGGALKNMGSFQHLSAVGVAVAQLYQALAGVMGELAAVHQVKHYHDVSRLRKAVLEHALADFKLFEKEESFRQHSQSQAKLLDGMSAAPHNRRGGAHAEFSGNLLQESLVGDDALLVAAVAEQQQLPAKQLLEVVLMRDELLRQCYTAEVWWLVYQVQCRALGWKVSSIDYKPISWDNVNAEGSQLRAESVSDVLSAAEPDDVSAPHASGPPGAEVPPLPAMPERHGSTPGIGRTAVLGCVWRAPNIAFNEFCDDLACSLDVHSLLKLCAVLKPGSIEASALQAAVQSEKLRAASLQVTVQHNQVLLDQIIRALLRKQNTLLFAASTSHAKRMKQDQAQQLAPEGAGEPSILEWPPNTIRTELSRRAGMNCTSNQLVEGGAARVAGQLREYRRDLIHAVQPLCLELQSHKIQARNAARRQFASLVRQHTQASERSHDTSSSKLGAHAHYVSELARALLPFSVKLDLIRSASTMADLVLGSTGGSAGSWGVLPTGPGQTTNAPPELQKDASPFFPARVPATWLQRLVLEYGPLWQATDPEPPAAGYRPPDLSKYHPVGGLPHGVCFPDDEGKFRLDQLTVLPSILDIVSWQPSCSSACDLPPLEQLEMAADMMRALVQLSQRHVFQESFQVAAAHIAQAGDITCGHQNQAICESVLAAGRQQVQPPAVINTAVGAFQANQASSLPCAMLAPLFIDLKAIIDHLPRQTGRTGAGAKKVGGSPLMKSVIQYLHRRSNLLTFQHLLAVSRCNSYCGPSPLHSPKASSQGPSPAKHAFALEEALALWLSGGPALAPQATVLRLRDDVRCAIYNTMLEVSLTLEQAAADRNLPPLLAPLEALQLQERLCTVLWVHDRLQEALTYRQAQMDVPFLFDGEHLSESQYLKAYKKPKLLQPFCPAGPAQTWLQRFYADTVVLRAKDAVDEVLEQTAGTKEAAPSSGTLAQLGAEAGAGSDEAPPAVLAEAAVKVMKQLIDRQCMLLATTKLKAGIKQLAAQCSAREKRQQLQVESAVLPTPKYAENASMLFLRRVFGGRGRQQDGQPEEEDPQTREVRKDDLLRWSQDFIRQASAECIASTTALLEGSEMERQNLRRMIQDVQGRMQDFEARQAVEVQQRVVRVETQVLDRAMDMVATLGAMRRTKAQLQTLATNAVEKAYEKAHSQYAGRIEELERELEVARLNLKEVRAEMQQSALEALGEIKAEMLAKAFGQATGGPRSPGSPTAPRIGDGDHEGLLEARAEVAELQRAMAKIQAWFKIRSQAFQSACRSENEAAGKKVEQLQAENWEMRERHETELQNLQQHLAATQRQLEAVVGELQQRSMEVLSLTASNRRLMRERVCAMNARGRGGATKGASTERLQTAESLSAEARPGTLSRPGSPSLGPAPLLRSLSRPGTPMTQPSMSMMSGSLRPVSPLMSTGSESLQRPGTPPTQGTMGMGSSLRPGLALASSTSGSLSRPGTPGGLSLRGRGGHNG